ncbi:MAG TPA: tRNA preQ1(34) S-adenosylmethionine ribosyltransferase-isomerase QueA [Vicinamibacteria bacterium]|nr:tRNA preQ1(34) S-adenosylmethionine ribosyltransferase-isomerase QueA [Vicinamibacteria bacterium]
MKVADFDYALPPGRIAQEPLADRDASRLLVLDRSKGALRHEYFRDLPELLRSGDLLVVNRSRVFPARLLGRRPKSGGRVEVFLLRPVGEADEWEALLHPGRRLRSGDAVRVGPDLTVTVLSAAYGHDARRRVRVEAPDVWGAIDRLGHTPLPPYVSRPDRPEDRERYQTVYARERGSVAAPTAGLHFTPALLERLAARGVERTEIVLHVGPGTFRPVKAENVEEHRVDPEPFVIPEATAERIAAARDRGSRVVCVGTTTVRALETRARDDGGVEPGAGETDCVIVPGFRFRVTDALVTNFHLPRSSLLLLVAAFSGRERVLSAYAEAVRLGYRFYSYGDAMLIE